MSHSALYVARSLVGSRFLKHPGFFCVMTTTRNKSSAVSLLKKGKCSAVDRLENMSIKLGEAAHQVLVTPNAGGDSVVSECLSVEVLSRLLFSNDTTLIATEMDIRYFPSGGSMTDYLIKWGTANVSVSVTRVFDGADLDGASRILEKKLRGVAFARKSLFAPVQGSECSWILHIFVPNGKVAKLVKKAWGKLDESVRGGVVVVVTIWKETALYDRTR
ncbi:hypothetical protein BCR33DRAFT_713228 [Rhizoclosmatium globosum]|uniref:Uncharacterized protein n=1 Tax=Rhizoclosmatium globosum TaxID=329046 RepID=A0A1Y2CTN4_9FUNG|nr:hypothetical protein BCR33DRAFT_713228 [Rhizoclosmatium globosum]|eukprot:ORY50418.1 hypothetical protein BCR33DRAFT_713228 [Rhizoclosmatium globosum]